MKALVRISSSLLLLALVGLPLLLYSLYLGTVAADRFVSESIITVRQAGSEPGGGVPGAAMLLAGITPPAHEDTLFLKQFVHSLGLLLKLRDHRGTDAALLESRR